MLYGTENVKQLHGLSAKIDCIHQLQQNSMRTLKSTSRLANKTPINENNIKIVDSNESLDNAYFLVKPKTESKTSKLFKSKKTQEHLQKLFNETALHDGPLDSLETSFVGSDVELETIRNTFSS